MTIDLLPSEEHEEIMASVRTVLAKDETSWTDYAELGWFGLGLPEALGGVGYGLAEEALLFREIGRHLASGPFLGTTLGARIADDADRMRILNGQANVAWGRRDRDRVFVFDGTDASFVLLGDDLFDIALLSDRVDLLSIDPLTSVGTGLLHGTPVSTGALALRAHLLIAAMFTGLAERARDLGVAHARDRHQFGRPIGVHQAIKHPCADMAVRCEAASAQLFVAALQVDAAAPEADFNALCAVVVASNAAFANARANVQIHGGMGFTTAHPAQLLVKRAHVLDRMLGGTQDLLGQLLDL
jgi:alkylation response protein AidB-like acyl-CoA dehydrogenase